MEFHLEVLVVLNIFVGERSLEPPLHLAATDDNRQLEDVFTVLKAHKEIVFQLLVFLF